MEPCVASRSAAVVTAMMMACSFGCGKSLGNPGERDAVKMIQKLGGKVEFDGEGNDQRVIKVYLNSTAIKDTDLGPLEQLSKLRNLFLGKTQISDAGLKHLQGFGDLQTLSLNSTHVTDAGLEPLFKLTKLKTINLQETDVTAAGVARLRKALPGTMIAR